MAADERIYDSASRAGPSAFLRETWPLRELVVLLARREVFGRYRQAVLGAAWTVITPLVYAGTLWLVFSHLARFRSDGVPYVVYVLSGVLVLNFVSQALLGVAGSVVTNTVVLRRVNVPVGVFAAASALAALVTLALMTLTLLAVQVVSGEGVRLTALLLPVAFVLLALTVAGAGLVVGALAAVYVDALEMTRIVLTLAGFLTPVFYPVSIVPGRWRYAIEANPISLFLRLFRGLEYGGDLGSWWTLPACAVIAVGSPAVGLLVFTRVRQALPTVL